VFVQRDSIRRLAAKVLLVWLFALATGVVNACVIAPASPPLPIATVVAAVGGDHGPVVHLPGCHECEGEGEGEAGGRPAGCAKFCADEASSVPAAKQVHDPGPGLGIALVPTMALAVAAPVRGAAAVGGGVLPPPPRPSIPIAYLRLTL
jgi:hypothetical protein